MTATSGRAATVAIAIAAALAGCAKKRDDDSRARTQPADPVPAMTIAPAEIQRGQDACKAYVDRVCACAQTVTAAKSACELARALPDAVRISVEVASSPDSSHGDMLHAQDSLRKTAAECIEQTAKLPTLGCP